jgi:APA family basic amino acid/polyamine antiporter
LAFGTYLLPIWPGSSPVWSAFLVVTVVTAFHLINLGTSAVFQNVFSLLKIALVLGLALAGWWLGSAPELSWGWSTTVAQEVATPAFAISLMFALYAYSGWNAATYILGEVKNPGRTVGLALLTGTLVVMGLYVLLNASFLLVAPVE